MASSKTYDLPCMTCRRRKVRCSKTWPCSNCQRAETECSFDDSSLASKRPSKIDDLAERLAKMEALVRDLSLQAGLDDGPVAVEQVGMQQDRAPVDVEASKTGRLVFESGRSRYLQSGFWANWYDEVCQ